MKRTAGTMLVLAALGGCLPIQTDRGFSGRNGSPGLVGPVTAARTSSGLGSPLYEQRPVAAGAPTGLPTGTPKGPGGASAFAASSKGLTGSTSAGPPLLVPAALASARPAPPPVAGSGSVTKEPLSPSPAATGPAPLPSALMKPFPLTPPDALGAEAKPPCAEGACCPDKDPGSTVQAGYVPEARPKAPASPPDASPPTPAVEKGARGPSPKAPMMRLVNTKRITLNFEVQDVGPSGVAAVELWYTQDAKKWHKYDAPAKAHAYVIEVDQQGMYGFTLLARNGHGVAPEPPKEGDLPQVWVVVDLTEPKLHIDRVEPRLGGKVNVVTIRWTARDDNLGRQPIRLSYSANENGPWAPIAGRLPNTGHFEWAVPAQVPTTLFLRVEATDLAGNQSVARTTEPIIVDTKQPRVSIIEVSPNR